jgi:hypothetical protein
MRQRMRRLLVMVVVVDVIGGGALAFALTRPGSQHQKRPHRTQTTAVVAHPSNPLTETIGSETSTAGHEAASTTNATTSTTAASAPPRTHHVRRVVHRPQMVGCNLNLRAARAAAFSEMSAGYRVGFALVTSSGQTLASVNQNAQNYGASITKSMLLVAFLEDHATQGLDSESIQELTAMIEVSDNEAADWVYAHLSSPSREVEDVASAAGMTGFRLDLSDPVYVLGQSLVTAHGFAQFFANIQSMMPARYRKFGMNLLGHVEQRVGLLAAGLPGTVFSKEGWKPEGSGLLGAPYVVNQAAQFSCRGVRYGIAVTVGHAEDETSAEAVVQRIASSLMNY